MYNLFCDEVILKNIQKNAQVSGVIMSKDTNQALKDTGCRVDFKVNPVLEYPLESISLGKQGFQFDVTFLVD
jgi:hypothetical protein